MDLITTFTDQPLDQVSVDHSIQLVFCRTTLCPRVTSLLPLAKMMSLKGWFVVGGALIVMSYVALCSIVHSVSRRPPENADVDELFAVYDRVLRDIADRVAPQHSIRRHTTHLAPWFDDRCRQARRESRRLERRHRRTEAADDRRQWIDAFSTITDSETGILGRSAVSALTLSSMLGRSRDVAAPNDFAADST